MLDQRAGAVNRVRWVGNASSLFNGGTMRISFCIAGIAVHVWSASASATPGGPADQTAPITPLHHRSAFEDYRPFNPRATAAWREANDTVQKIGGWRAYAKEATEAAKQRERVDATPRPLSAPAPTPAPAVAPQTVPAKPGHIHRHGG